MWQRAVFISVLLILGGCASVGDLPDSAAKVDFGLPGSQSVAKWGYEDCAVYKNIDLQTIYRAAEATLLANQFVIKKASFAGGVLMGEHGPSGVDWNVVAGVYFREQADGLALKVIARRSKNISLMKESVDENWAQKLTREITDYVRAQSVADIPAMECR